MLRRREEKELGRPRFWNFRLQTSTDFIGDKRDSVTLIIRKVMKS